MGRERSIRAVFFDVDFTLIYPGRKFDGEGYRSFASHYGLSVDPLRFDEAIDLATGELNQLKDEVYRPEPFVRYARRVLVEMGAAGNHIDRCAQDIYDQWALSEYFLLYNDVKPTFVELYESGYLIGLISNTHRCLDSFQDYFGLGPYISAAISSSEHGYLKPHPSIFWAALNLIGVSPDQGIMVGDSMAHDVTGAQNVGMNAVLLARSGFRGADIGAEIQTIQTLSELPLMLSRWPR